MADQPPSDLVPVDTSSAAPAAAGAPPSDLVPVDAAAAPHQHKRWDVIGDIVDAWTKPAAAPAAPLGYRTNRSGLAIPVEPPDTTPDTPRWDIGGDIARDFHAGGHAFAGDVAAGFRSGKEVEREEEKNRENYGAVGGYLKDKLIDTPVQAAHVAKLPLDALAMVASPVTGLAKGTIGSALSYAPGSSKRQADAALDLLGALAGGETGLKGAGKVGGAMREVSASERAAKNTEKAMAIVARRAEQDKVTPDAWEQAKAAAAKSGDKLSLMDMGKNLRNRAGKAFRSPGDSGSILDVFLKGRDKEVGPQLDREIEKIAKGSTYDAINHLYGARSEAAGPIFEQAFDHGSTAPFQRSYEKAFGEVGAAEQEAIRRVQAAKNLEMSAQSRVVTGGTRPLEQAGELRAKTAEAEMHLEAIQAQKQRTTELMRKAQEDGTANAPGAVWSPRLEEFRSDPDVAAGLKRGLKIEKKRALAEGRPFHDRDYAIIGYDEHGDPIVGTVPTMKAWAAAKEGMDAIVLDQVHPIGTTSAGRPTKEGLANRELRDALRGELVALNPKYGEAINAWSGPSESIDAVRAGKEHFTRQESDDQVLDEFNKMTEANKEFYRLGAAEHLIDKNARVAIAGDESKAMVNTRRDEARVRMLFKDPKDADAFMEQVMRKRQMFETKQKVAGGSDTAERVSEDRSRLATAGQHALTAGERFIKGHPLTAIREAWRGGQALVTNKSREEEIAKIFADPNAKLPAPKGPRRPQSLGELVQEASGQPAP